MKNGSAVLRVVPWAVALVSFACGKSSSGSAAVDAGGTAGSVASGGQSGRSEVAMSGGGGAGMSSLPSGGRAAGGDTSTGGSARDALGGRTGAGTSGSSVAGSAAFAGGNAAGASAGFGGQASGAAGGALMGDAGAAGSPEFACEGPYDACGCGCCGAAMSAGCYYPEHGDDLTAIKADDQAIAMEPSCAQAGCASGTHFLCCETAALEANVSYAWHFWSNDTGHVWLTRESPDQRCTSVVLALPGADGGPPAFEFPEQWPLADSSTRDGVCDSLTVSPARAAIGALGFLKPTPSCVNSFDFDFTLFFLSETGTVDPVRFKAQGVAFQSNGGSVCP